LSDIPTDINSNDNTPIQEKITIKKSTYHNLLKGLVVAIALTTFFGGYVVGTYDD